MFGAAPMLGNLNGGLNFFYVYLDMSCTLAGCLRWKGVKVDSPGLRHVVH
jgi:hypothetical protein